MNALTEKLCRTCKNILPLEKFDLYLSGPRVGRPLSKCQECKKTVDQLYMAEWRAKNQDRAAKADQNQRAKRLANPEYYRQIERISAANLRRKLNLLKMDRPCYDCGGIFPPECMDWDHIPGKQKRFNIGANQKSFGLESCIDEINKCQLVCSNCHRLRTASRKQKGEE